jgi:tetratricopeptide (TPR) repeat protein
VPGTGTSGPGPWPLAPGKMCSRPDLAPPQAGAIPLGAIFMTLRRLLSLLAIAMLAAPLLGSFHPTRAQDPSSALAERAELDKALTATSDQRIALLEKFIAAHPMSVLAEQAQEALVRSHATVGEQALKAGDPKAAAAAFEKALAAAPEKIPDRLFASVIWQMPVVMAAAGYRFDGIQLMRSFEPRFESDASRMIRIGYFYVSIESARDAVRVLEKAVKLDPDNHQARNSLGTAYILSLRLDDAANEFVKAIELDPKEEFAYTSLANLRRATGNPVEAIDLYKKQLEIKPDDAPTHAGLALAYLLADDDAAASNALGRAIALSANDFRFYTQLAYFYVSRGRTDKAREAIELALKYEPRFAWAHIVLGNILLSERRYREAIEALTQAQAYGDFPTLHFELGKTLMVTDNYDGALDRFHAAFDITEDGQYETNLGDVLPLRTSKLDRLLERERQAVLFLYEQPTTATQYRLAEALSRIGYFLESIPDEPTSVRPKADAEGAAILAPGNPTGLLMSTLVAFPLADAPQVPQSQSRPRRALPVPDAPSTDEGDREKATDTETPRESTPSTETPSTETPSVDTPSAETPGVETPSVDTPSTETTGTDAPAEKAPASDAQVAAPEGGSDLVVPLPGSSVTTPSTSESAPPANGDSTPAAVPAGDAEVISADPRPTPGDAPLVFRPGRAAPVSAPPDEPPPVEGARTETQPASVGVTDPETPGATESSAETGNTASGVAAASEATTPTPASDEKPELAQPAAKSPGRKIEPAILEGLNAAIDEFVNVDDGREPFRKIWVARRLADKNVLLDRAELLATQALDAAATAIEPERSIRDMVDLDRDARLAVFTARVEDTLGWVLLKRGNLEEALTHLARGAEGPAKDPDFRTRVWHLAIAKEESGEQKEALDLYIRGYDPSATDAPVRKTVIEQLYRKVNNGSLSGLDEKLKAN